MRDTETLKLVVDHFADLVLASYVVGFRPPASSDGTPLKVSLQRSLRRSKLRAAGLVSLPLLFLLVVFVIPIVDLMLRSVDPQLPTSLSRRAVTDLLRGELGFEYLEV